MPAYVPSYANPFPTYQPSMRVIAAITKSFPATVTTTFAHQYLSGTIIRLDIPLSGGMTQANQMFGPITVTGSTTFTIPIDTTYFDTFTVPTAFPPAYQDSQAVPIGEDNDMLTAAVQNVLPYPAT